jgi:hypothetical protein
MRLLISVRPRHPNFEVRSAEIVLQRIFPDDLIGQLTAKVKLNHTRANDDVPQENFRNILVSRDPSADAYHRVLV